MQYILYYRSAFIIIYSRGFKHKAWGSELAQQRVRSVPLDAFGGKKGRQYILDFKLCFNMFCNLSPMAVHVTPK